MSDTSLMVLGVFELAGLIGLFLLVRWNVKRRAAGKQRLRRPVRIAVALFGLLIVVGFPVLMIVSIMNPSLQNERLHAKLVETGTRATATITSVEETGTLINRRPEVRVRMRVQPQDGPAFDSQWTWVFSVKDVQTYRVGIKANVFFDPKDHGAVAVVGVAPPEK
jgi:hypothetical protein